MEVSWINGLIGGALIGSASLLAMTATGKVPGISGVFARVLRPLSNEISWRLLFLAGLIAGAFLMYRTHEPSAVFRVPEGRSLIVYGMAGIVVGFGTRLGGGCTSGHGICGIGMGARDSIIATVIFMASGMVTVLIYRMLLGG